MNCLNCTTKDCRVAQKDCNGLRDSVLATYAKDDLHQSLHHADLLVRDGKAGNVSRIDEIIEYALHEKYKHITIAYCFSLEDTAITLRTYLKKAGLHVTSVRCTVNGIAEKHLLKNEKESVNCNPVGQAAAINKSSADFVIEMGLCLGHDILFHKYIEKPFTVFMVKDRVHNHAPQNALFPKEQIDPSIGFMNTLPNDFYLRTPAWVAEQIEQNTPLLLIDFRAKIAFDSASIPQSKRVPLDDLTNNYTTLFPNKNALIVTICNGGLQSIYAVMFLRLHGYTQVFTLTGGFSRWQKEERLIITNT